MIAEVVEMRKVLTGEEYEAVRRGMLLRLRIQAGYDDAVAEAQRVQRDVKYEREAHNNEFWAERGALIDAIEATHRGW